MCGQTNADNHNKNVRVIPNKCGANVNEIDKKRCPDWYTANVWNIDINKIHDWFLLSHACNNIVKL